MKKLITICATATMILMIGGVANAHWDQNDPYKMHYPQLPDPCGWDVSFNNTVLADDWQCTESGLVKDIHFWVSFKGNFTPSENFVGPTLNVAIFSNAGEVGQSYPNELLWEGTFTGDQYDGDYAGSGLQGWFDLTTGTVIADDHTDYYLLNIDSIENPFLQVKDQIYWLEIQAILPEDANYEVGWKTSGSEHFMDGALYSIVGGGGRLVYPSNDPYGRGGSSIDLAFVITPEPATICLLAIGSLVFIGRKK